MLVILHNIRSQYNVGSIFRTADAAGIEKVYLCGITPGPVDRFGEMNEKLRKVSLGAEKSVLWERALSTTRLLDKLKKDGYTILAVEQHPKSTKLKKIKLSKRARYAIVFGNEVRGLSPAILKRADTIIEIPMRGKKESLNVSVACGIVLYTLL